MSGRRGVFVVAGVLILLVLFPALFNLALEPFVSYSGGTQQIVPPTPSSQR